MGALAHQRQAQNHDWSDLDSTTSPWASITQTPKAFDFEHSHRPAQFHNTGPFHDINYREKVEFPWHQLTGQPLVYASMGTILNGRPEVGKVTNVREYIDTLVLARRFEMAASPTA